GGPAALVLLRHRLPGGATALDGHRQPRLRERRERLQVRLRDAAAAGHRETHRLPLADGPQPSSFLVPTAAPRLQVNARAVCRMTPAMASTWASVYFSFQGSTTTPASASTAPGVSSLP